MKYVKKMFLLLCLGSLYNLYFTLIHASFMTWVNILVFILLGYVEWLVLEWFFTYSLSFQKNIYLQIVTIFCLSTIIEIVYLLLTGLSLTIAWHFVLVGLPLTLLGLLYWKYHVSKLQKLLRNKKSRL